ncbi:unnamed protein product (mitochondrion) [Plasmodiophora brassicae]|uniref:Uncharacterized protein n=1 Tax=Plasmodiophora brassicae TaxID=37360 RepID=A0A3P3YM52_PLABS|nr:unnamed protein product [Plasmodiophora brassicae]
MDSDKNDAVGVGTRCAADSRIMSRAPEDEADQDDRIERRQLMHPAIVVRLPINCRSCRGASVPGYTYAIVMFTAIPATRHRHRRSGDRPPDGRDHLHGFYPAAMGL